MPIEVMVAILVEAILVSITILLVTQPAVVFEQTAVKAKNMMMVGGFVFMCITFCWSFVLGCAIALNDLNGFF